MNYKERDSFVDVIMDGEVGTDDSVGAVVSHVEMFEEYLFHILWILSNNRPGLGTRTGHVTYDGFDCTAKCEEGDHGSSSADEIDTD